MSGVVVIGAGVVGLTVALTLAERGAKVTLVERSHELGGNASWLAGGMLAPFCEGESAPQSVVDLGKGAIDWWGARVPGVARAGTLVVAPPRDVGEIDRFAQRTCGHERVNEARIAALEPDLLRKSAGRFRVLQGTNPTVGLDQPTLRRCHDVMLADVGEISIRDVPQLGGEVFDLDLPTLAGQRMGYAV